jgi:hypothetical protein
MSVKVPGTASLLKDMKERKKENNNKTKGESK